MKANVLNILLSGFLLVALLCLINQYSDSQSTHRQITELKDKLSEAEQKTFALGENLLNKKHTFDLKFIITDNDNIQHEFYTHKHILRVNSEYFDLYLSRNNTDVINYKNISKQEFNAVIEILYLGKFRTNIIISSIPQIVKYLDTFRLIDTYRNYTDPYFANMINGWNNYKYLNDIDEVAKLYNLSKKYSLYQTRTSILNNIYHNWKAQGLFNEKHLVEYPALFYDYIRMHNCEKLTFR